MIPTNTIVIIPTYNEEKTIFNVVSSVKKEHPFFDVVVIDDGSTDDTANYATQAGALVLSHPFNMGYGATIQTGYKYAHRQDYKHLVQLDGDGQHDTMEIKVLLDALNGDSCDIVLGSRYIVFGDYRASPYRYAGTILFRSLVRLFTKIKITDPTTGFQAMNRKVLRIFVQDLFPCDYPDADVIVLLSTLNIRIKEVPVRMYYNHKGKSMHSNPLNAFYYVFKMILSMALTLLRKY